MGPLRGLRVIEIAGLGPAPFCAMMLSDMGAEVLRIERKGEQRHGRFEVMQRGRRSLAFDLKRPEGVQAVLKLIGKADAVIEGFRPGVMERLGLGPKVCMELNPRLVYGRVTGWGQEGPLAKAAGHDINYIALTGALHAIGRCGDGPVPPLNLVGDFGGGGMMLAFGVVSALWESQHSGKGQVVDAAMTDGASLLMAIIYGFKAAGIWHNERGTNALDGGAHFYGVYECADGKFVSIGPLEPQFYQLLLDKCGLDEKSLPQGSRDEWPQSRLELAAVFKRKTQSQWCTLLEGTDACFAPVLDLDEAPHHPHNLARGTFVEIDGVTQPAPAPRFSRTPPEIQGPPSLPEIDPEGVLSQWGMSGDEIGALVESGAI